MTMVVVMSRVGTVESEITVVICATLMRREYFNISQVHGLHRVHLMRTHHVSNHMV